MGLEKKGTITSRPIIKGRPCLVEMPTVFSFEGCELTLYETLEEAEGIPFQFNYPTVAIMLSGKKVLQIEQERFEFLPGSVFIVAPEVPITIDLPGASLSEPTLCLTLNIDRNVIIKQIEILLKNQSASSAHKKIQYLQDHENYLLFEEQTIYSVSQRIAALAQEKNQDYETIMQIAVSELIVRLSQTHSCELLLKSAKVQNVTDNFSNAIDYINTNYTKPISIQMLCSIACVSKAVLFRKFKTAFGLTPLDYISNKKLEAAKRMLDSETHYTVKQISRECGFSTESYFNQIFKRDTGITPVMYRRRFNQ